MGLARRYDLINQALFLPTGGSGRLRQAVVDALALGPGDRVLELGCGTGQVTARLVSAGATVTAVDALPDMLDAARRRAPTAHLIQGDAFEVEVGGDYDAIVLAFVLHNFGAPDRRRLLGRAAAALGSGGRVAVLDWSCPDGRRRAQLWRAFLRSLEPSPSVLEVADGQLGEDVAAAGLALRFERPLSLGRVHLMVAVLPAEAGRVG